MAVMEKVKRMFGNGVQSDDVKRAQEHQAKTKKKEADDLVRVKKQEIEESELKHKASTLTSAYQKLFNSDLGQLVLNDLKDKCFYNSTGYNEDQNQFLMNTGMTKTIHIINKQLNDKG